MNINNYAPPPTRRKWIYCHDCGSGNTVYSSDFTSVRKEGYLYDCQECGKDILVRTQMEISFLSGPFRGSI